MKVSLISSWKTYSSHPPLGIAYIAAVLREHDINVDVIDFESVNSTKDIERELRRSNPTILGISAMSPTYDQAREIAYIAKSCIPDVTVMMGGPHPTIMPENVLSDENVDIAVIGEGDYTVLDVVNACRNNGTGLRSVKGIYFKENGNIRKTDNRGYIQDLDVLPFPARDLLPMDQYLSRTMPFPMPFPETNLIAVRGCPFNCSYCQPTSKMMFGKKIRYRSPENVVAEMEHLKKRYKVKYQWVGGDTLTVNRKWVNSFCNLLIERDLDIEWIAGTRVDTVDKEMLKLMKKSGCIFITFGVESGSQRILDEIMNKRITIKQVRDAFRSCNEEGIAAMANFMIGSPTETKEDLEMSLELMKEILPDSIATYITNPLPGTHLYDYAMEKCLITTTDLSRIDRHAVGTLKREHLTDKKIDDFIDQMNKEFSQLRASYFYKPKLVIKKKHFYQLLLKRMIGLFCHKPFEASKELIVHACKYFNYLFQACFGSVVRYMSLQR
ncbi:MAG: radical SAM protein [Methanocellales archaeon]|nr:radical SAM protein [Methanocellales archaeon]